ncbi:MAG: GAK system XXXCH domain-containing protein [Spirochaetes bacterium]|nr:MAG: GAK system XXXCH domain-containing protein [Spirochaetota bacterium]
MKKKSDKAKKRRKEKFKNTIAMQDLPQHLRSLADIIEKGKVPLSENLNIESLSSLKLLFKYNDYQNIVRTRIHFEYAVEPENPSGTDVQTKTIFIEKKGKKKKPSLKKLKKRMDKTLEILSSAIAAGSIPDTDLADEFYNDCESLVLLENDGNTFLEEYLRSASILVQAVKANDIQQARGAAERLRYIQSEANPLETDDKK